MTSKHHLPLLKEIALCQTPLLASYALNCDELCAPNM